MPGDDHISQGGRVIGNSFRSPLRGVCSRAISRQGVTISSPATRRSFKSPKWYASTYPRMQTAFFPSPDHCLRSRQYFYLIVSGKQPALDYLDIDQAVAHCTRGIGVWDWASTEAEEEEPDVVPATCRHWNRLPLLTSSGSIFPRSRFAL